MTRHHDQSMPMASNPERDTSASFLLSVLIRPCRSFASSSTFSSKLATRAMYCLLLLTATVLMAAATMFPAVQHRLQDVFRDFHATCTDLGIVPASNDCMKLTGYMAALKVSFSFACFFILMAGATFCWTSPSLQHGFWTLKLLLLMALLVAVFVVPLSHLNQLYTAWVIITHAGNWLFIMLQGYCLVDFTSEVRKHLTGATLSQRLAQTALALAALSAWLALSVALFLIHGRQDFCLTKKLSLVTNTGLCICILLTSLTPCARKATSDTFGTGISWRQYSAYSYASQLFQSGLVAIIVTFWTWSAMQSAPETPGWLERVFLLDEDEDPDEQLLCYLPRSFLVEGSLTYAALVLMLLTLAYLGSCSTSKDLPKAPLHVALALAVMFATAQLTRWFQPGNSSSGLDRNWSTTTLKLTCAWSAAILYMLYLLLPDQCLPVKKKKSNCNNSSSHRASRLDMPITPGMMNSHI